jgi:hypothetical protein
VIECLRRTLGGSREPVSRVLPLREVTWMSEDGRNRLSSNETEERDSLLTKVISLVPLFDLVIRLLELLLKALRIIN